MLTQGPTPDPKCKLIISTFFTLPRLLDCLLCARNAMSIVMVGRGKGGRGRGGWLIYIRVWGEEGQGVGIMVYFLFLSSVFVFCCLIFSDALFR